jgi:hypothetical protein
VDICCGSPKDCDFHREEGPAVRELHVVAVSEDGRHVLLGATRSAKTGTFKVKLDERLMAAVKGDLRLAEAPAVELSPKEIQARLRAGESAESIARKAGVAITRVERFAGPVSGEMARMIDAARDQKLVRRSGPSQVALGKAVDAQVGEAEATWTTLREEDGRWRVSVAWTARNRRRTGAWFFDPHSNELTAADPASATLGHVAEPTAKRPPKPPAEKPAAKKPTAKKPTVAKKAPAKAEAPKPAKRKAARPRLQVVPDPPAKRKARTAAEERDGVGSRASVPAWADVLLGTTPTKR